MPKVKEVIYVIHPVPATLKQEILEAGYRILDARFAPEDAEVLDPATVDAEITGPDDEELTPEGIDKMKKQDLVEHLEAHGAGIDGSVPELRERLKKTVFVDL